MAVTEKRSGVPRRGMTVLGKVPVAPKPINLPSQRSTFALENLGRFSSSIIIPGKFESALLNPENSSEKNEKSISTQLETSQGGADYKEKKVHAFPASGRMDSSSSATVSNNIKDSDNVVKVDEPRQCCTCKLSGNQIQGPVDPPIRKSRSGCLGVPPGFTQTSANFSNAQTGIPLADSQCGHLGNQTNANFYQQNGPQSTDHLSNFTDVKDREIIVIHMVGGPGFYGNYPPQLGFPDSYYRNGVYGSLPLQFGNFEPVFGPQGFERLEGLFQPPTVKGPGFYDKHEDFICYEKKCYMEGGHGRHRNSHMLGCYNGNSSHGNAKGEVSDSLMRSSKSAVKSRSSPHKFLPRNGGSRSPYHYGMVVASSTEETTTAAEKQITLLTKVSHHDKEVCSAKEVGVETPSLAVSSSYSNVHFNEDEGKAPRNLINAEISESIQVENVPPADGFMKSKKTDETTALDGTLFTSNKVSLSKESDNGRCLHCKGNASSKEPTDEVLTEALEKDRFMDGCKDEEKHVILNSDDNGPNTIKSEVVREEQTIAQEHLASSVSCKPGDVQMGLDIHSDASLKKSVGKHQKIVFKKKLQSKSIVKPGFRVRKIHVISRKPDFQVDNRTLSHNSADDSKESSQGVKMQGKVDGQDNNSSSWGSQYRRSDHNYSLSSESNKSEVLQIGASLQTVSFPKRILTKPQKLFYRKKKEEQSAMELEARTDGSKLKSPGQPLPFSSHPKNEITYDRDNEKVSHSISDYHIIQRRVYHVVDGIEGDCDALTSLITCDDKGHLSNSEMKEMLVPGSMAHWQPPQVGSHLAQKSGSQVERRNSWSRARTQQRIPNPQTQRSCPNMEEDSTMNKHCKAGRQEDNMRKKQTKVIGEEDNMTKQHPKSGRHYSAWKPKLTQKTTENPSLKKQNQGKMPPCTLVEAAAGEKSDTSYSGMVELLNAQYHCAEAFEELFAGTSSGLSFDQHRPRSESSICTEKHISSQEDSPLPIEPAGMPVDTSASNEDLGMVIIPDHTKHTPAVPSPDASSHDNAWALATEQDNEVCVLEKNPGNQKHFIKKNRMSREKADHYHQILFKRYKEIGQWKPKFEINKNPSKLHQKAGYTS
ncbi:hypothetical protein KP509_33G021800 [Ceratopteris richardii]|uniref:Uncharacterized protein n=1 Tax=Ceratopteris richardii TaxID=49495 RepID=A0A8T2QMS9_CERRI|nr:hypothetical protein KP509_33G021800 [Ceratopteris richardii]KAH7285308.1 hypothetical protein KP509_33G021800 [Ceratopteris richardii]KAH7285310.1 hypothetical protein KP509_33G021800 [Ceratopteris richardii]